MRVVVLASQKGGSGKTTLSGHIAVEAERRGAGPVAVIDTDPQGSLAGWWNARSDQTPLFVRTDLPRLEQSLDKLCRQGIGLAVIDTPPAITTAITQVVSLATLVVIPIRPSPHDLRAAAATVDLVETIERPFVFVINAASPRARITGDSAVLLSQYGTVAPVMINHRLDYATSMTHGGTVMETNKSDNRSADEVGELWTYLADRLDRASQRGLEFQPLFDSEEPREAMLVRPRPTFGRRNTFVEAAR